MGLDVSVYKNVVKTDDDGNYSFMAFTINEDWDYKIKNLEKNSFYNGQICDCDVSYSYGSHNRFREELVKMLGRNDLISNNGRIDWYELIKEKDLPFYDLIYFADNEGCMDWEVSAKLYENFKDNLDKAKIYFSTDLYFLEKYNDWLKVFENGKEINSVVVFT